MWREKNQKTGETRGTKRNKRNDRSEENKRTKGSKKKKVKVEQKEQEKSITTNFMDIFPRNFVHELPSREKPRDYIRKKNIKEVVIFSF